VGHFKGSLKMKLDLVFLGSEATTHTPPINRGGACVIARRVIGVIGAVIGVLCVDAADP